MKSASRRGFFISAILHGIFFLVLCFSFLLGSCSHRKVVKHVFQLQSAPQEEASSLLVKTSQLIAKVESKTEQKSKIESKVKVETTPKEKIVSKNVMSYEEFVKKQGRPKPSEVKASAKIVDTPKIQTKNVRNNLENKLSSITTPNIKERMDYESYFYSLIDAAWEYPESFEGYKNGAIFEFDVDSAGRILIVRITKTSGSRLFDESVRKAFNKVGIAKPNAQGKTRTFQLTFSKK